MRACEAWVAGKANLSADALAGLLRSEEGFEFLAEIIGDAKPVWWRLFKRRVRVAQILQKQKELREELDAVDRGDDTTA